MSSASAGSVTHWIAQLNEGNRQAAQELWNRYFHRVVGLARRKLQGLPSRMADEEDVAVSAFKSFFRRAEKGEFPKLESSDDLWPLLVRITGCKAYNLQRDERRAKRGGGKVLAVGTFPSDEELVAVIGSEPSEEFADQLAEEFRRLIALLPDEEYRRIAVLKLEGQTTAEISAALGINERRVQRRLKVTFATWREELSK
jgi:RNA polymerase sigma factor (sigma-70 family)